MKKLLVLILLLTGCSWSAPDPGSIQENAILAAIELAGYNLGYYIGKSKPESDDIAIADAYKFIREGKLTPQQIADAFAKFKLENPQLAGSLMIALKRMGAGFLPDGTLADISKIPIKYWDTAAEGYVTGYEFGLLGKKVIRVSAVKPLIPKK